MKEVAAKPRFEASVVEDEPEIRLAVKSAIEEVANAEQLECHVSLFREPADALARASTVPPNMVVMDFQNAGGGPSGWDVAARIRAKTGAEVIIYTANSGAASKRAESNPEFNAVILAKPATREEVCDKIREAIKRHGTPRLQFRTAEMGQAMKTARKAAISTTEEAFLSQLKAHGRQAL